MKKPMYIVAFIAMLVVLALTFYAQIKTFSSGNTYQWYLLMTIVVVGLGSYYLSKHMKKEGWFKIQQKKK